MTAKEYLEQIQKIDTLINNKIFEQRQWLDIALSCTASAGETVAIKNPKTGQIEMHGVEKVQSSSNGQSMANAIDNYIDLGRKIDLRIDEFYAQKQEIIATIEQLSEPEYDVLHKMYVQYLTFDEIAEKRDKSRRWVEITHGHALLNLEKILEENKAHIS